MCLKAWNAAMARFGVREVYSTGGGEFMDNDVTLPEAGGLVQIPCLEVKPN
jgi:hypothetical protein